MANAEQLWQLSEARLHSAQILLQNSDWDGAAYMMGYALETALKASACKALNLSVYPENTKNKHLDNFFMTHKFDVLLIVSGCSNLFEISAPTETSSKWSEFVQYYPGDWVTMRYDPNTVIRFNSVNVARLYDILYGSETSILKSIKARHQW